MRIWLRKAMLFGPKIHSHIQMPYFGLCPKRVGSSYGSKCCFSKNTPHYYPPYTPGSVVLLCHPNRYE